MTFTLFPANIGAASRDSLVLVDEQGTKGVLVTTNLIGLTAEIADPIRERISRRS